MKNTTNPAPATMFRATFALTTAGTAELTVTDTSGRLLAARTKHNVKTPHSLRTNLWWARTSLGQDYVLAEDAHWQRNADGQSWSAALVLRRATRYRLDLACGHSAWRSYGLAGARATTCDSCGGMQPITQYLDTMVGTVHVIMAG